MAEEQQPTGDVITKEDGVVEPTDGQQADSSVTTDDQQPQEDYYKNKAFELERKYTNTVGELSEIKEMLKKQQEVLTKPPDSQYTEEQLQAALSSDSLTPDQAAFAKTELNKLQNRKLEERDKKLLDEMERRTYEKATRQQAEQQVINDPRFQEAFIKLPNGTVQWKQDSQLAQMIGSYMNDSRLSGQPDAISIAAKLAYADMMALTQQNKLASVERENEQLKGQTMVEGGGRVYNKPQPDGFKDAMDQLKSGDRKAGRSAIKEFFRNRNAIR